MDKIEIGKIVKAQGIRGDVKVIVFADDSFNFSSIKQVYVNNTIAKVEKIYSVSGGYGVKLDIITSRNQAEEFRNCSVYVDKESINIESGRFFIADLIGKTVVLSTGETLGKITDIQNFGSADVFYISNNGKQILCSHIEGLIKELKDENLVLNAEVFKRVGIYEN